MIKSVVLDIPGSDHKLRYTQDSSHLVYLKDAGAGYYNCGYGCQWYDYNPGCVSCSPSPTAPVLSLLYFPGYPGSATSTTIYVGINCDSDGGSSLTEMGTCYSSSSPNPSLSGAHQHMSPIVGNSYMTVTGLTSSTPYYMGAFASNAVGTTYYYYGTTINTMI